MKLEIETLLRGYTGDSGDYQARGMSPTSPPLKIGLDYKKVAIHYENDL